MSDTKNLVYAGTSKSFHWAGFGSGSGTNLRACAESIPPSLIVCDRPKADLLGLEIFRDTPKIVHDGFKFCGSYKAARADATLLEVYERKSVEFNQLLVEGVRDFERSAGYTIDLIVLGGFMRLIKDPLLRAFPDKIINVHPGDTSVLDGNHERKYVGEEAIRLAIEDWCTATRSSVIFVDDKVDHGENITQGAYVDVWSEIVKADFPMSMLKDYIPVHQKLQKQLSDWPALTTALELISEGRVALGTEKNHFGKWRTVYVDGQEIPYEGIDVTLL